MSKQQAQQISKSEKFQAIKKAYTFEMFCAEMANDMNIEAAKHCNSEVTADEVKKIQGSWQAYENFCKIASLA